MKENNLKVKQVLHAAFLIVYLIEQVVQIHHADYSYKITASHDQERCVRYEELRLETLALHLHRC